jgi:3-isopropylmalate dehydrogenase
MKAQFVFIPGGNAGTEVLSEVRTVIDAVAAAYGHEFQIDERSAESGDLDATVTACQSAQVVLCGASGEPGSPFRDALSTLQKRLDLRAAVRPYRIYPQLWRGVLRPERLRGIDVLVVSESFHERDLPPEELRNRTRWVVELAFRLASRRWGHVVSVDASTLTGDSPLWREVADEVALNLRGAKLEHLPLNRAAMGLISTPGDYDVLVGPARVADMLVEQAAMLVGSPGLLAAAHLGEAGPGLYLPLNVSEPLAQTPPTAGRGRVNPLGAILAAAMALRHSLGMEREATVVEAAVGAAIAEGARTADLTSAGALSTHAMGDVVRAHLAADGATSYAI